MKIVEGFKLREVAGEWIVSGEGAAQVDFNKLLSLNSTAVYLWREIEGRDFTHEELEELLFERYDVQREQVTKDVDSILRVWRELNIIE